MLISSSDFKFTSECGFLILHITGRTGTGEQIQWHAHWFGYRRQSKPRKRSQRSQVKRKSAIKYLKPLSLFTGLILSLWFPLLLLGILVYLHLFRSIHNIYAQRKTCTRAHARTHTHKYSIIVGLLLYMIAFLSFSLSLFFKVLVCDLCTCDYARFIFRQVTFILFCR